VNTLIQNKYPLLARLSKQGNGRYKAERRRACPFHFRRGGKVPPFEISPKYEGDCCNERKESSEDDKEKKTGHPYFQLNSKN